MQGKWVPFHELWSPSHPFLLGAAILTIKSRHTGHFPFYCKRRTRKKYFLCSGELEVGGCWGGQGGGKHRDEWRWERLAAEQTDPDTDVELKQGNVVKRWVPRGSIAAPLRTTLGSPLEKPSIMDNSLLSFPPASISIAQKCASLMETLC